MTRSVLQIDDLAADDLAVIFDAAEESSPPQVLLGKGAALLFEHPSARTRNAAEMAVVQLGGHPVTIRGEEVGVDRRESAEDVARTFGSYHAVIGARVAHHEILMRFVAALERGGFDVPVVNLLSDYEHPTQALADLLTIRQHFGDFVGHSLAFIGDANNVFRSLAKGCVQVGMTIKIASPSGYELSEKERAEIEALGPGAIELGTPSEVAVGASVLYTDVWVSMGEENHGAQKRNAFSGFSIDERLLELARPDAVVMHCLPAHRGEEISAAVMEGPASVVWHQAENRMHALRGLLLFLCGSSI